MYCPNCAAPVEGAKFCRACGTNVSLVPQAISGYLPAQPVTDDTEDTRGRRRKRQPSLARGIQQIFMGLGFVCVALATNFWGPAGELWWYWLLIPAFSMLGGGIAEIVRAKQAERTMAMQYRVPAMPMPSGPRAVEMPTPATSQIKPPPSIVEDTTRRFDPAAERSGDKR